MVSPEIRTQLAELGLTPSQIESYARAYNDRNAATFRYIESGRIELRTDLFDAVIDPATSRVKGNASG